MMMERVPQKMYGKLDPSLTEITGLLSTIRYHGNGFLIGMLEGGTVIKGPLLAPQIGVEYILTGHVVNDPKWGQQFNFTDHTAKIPDDTDAFQRYLVANAKWIGPSVAMKVVVKYGKDAVRMCREEPERVAADISGITLARAREIAQMLGGVRENEELEIEVRGLLAGTGIGQGLLVRILDVFKKDTPKAIRENPYQLIEKVDGIGFLKADTIALKVGYERTGHFRLRAGILYVLENEAGMNGHVCLPRNQLVRLAVELLEVDALSIGKEISWLVQSAALVEHVEVIEDEDCPGTEIQAKVLYLPRLHADEQLVAERISLIVQHKAHEAEWVNLDQSLKPDQLEAIAKANKNAVFILTGAPGTGKTYAIRSIIDTAGKGVQVELAAPTGKAAKRIEEQTGIPARTMHRLLEPAMVNGKFVFSRNRDNPISADMIVLDETSMVDVSLMARFLEAVSAGTRVVFVGDVHQLPSVGPGNVLGEMIKSKSIPFTELTTIKRQNPGLIIRNCHAIKDGKPLTLKEDWTEDFVFVGREENDDIRSYVVDLATKLLPQARKLDPVADIQVIVPMRERTNLSAAAFNAELRARLNPNAVDAPTDGPYRPIVGDKVIQTRNDYTHGVMNGDVGRVVEVNRKGGYVAVTFDTPVRTVELPLTMNNLELAYALTCHKFQGSESRVVILPVSRSYGPLVTQRNWLYTAASRAKDLLVMVGQKDEVPRMVSRSQPKRRYTRLAKMIGGVGYAVPR